MEEDEPAVGRQADVGLEAVPTGPDRVAWRPARDESGPGVPAESVGVDRGDSAHGAIVARRGPLAVTAV